MESNGTSGGREGKFGLFAAKAKQLHMQGTSYVLLMNLDGEQYQCSVKLTSWMLSPGWDGDTARSHMSGIR